MFAHRAFVGHLVARWSFEPKVGFVADISDFLSHKPSTVEHQFLTAHLEVCQHKHHCLGDKSGEFWLWKVNLLSM